MGDDFSGMKSVAERCTSYILPATKTRSTNQINQPTNQQMKQITSSIQASSLRSSRRLIEKKDRLVHVYSSVYLFRLVQSVAISKYLLLSCAASPFEGSKTFKRPNTMIFSTQVAEWH
jgi:hypothetical protein